MKTEHLNIISLSMGQQSVALYLMSCKGELPRADYAIFADTGAEKPETYAYLQWLQEWASQNDGIPIVTTSGGNLIEDMLVAKQQEKPFIKIPVHCMDDDGNKGILKQRCTDDYKTKPINRQIRKLYGLGSKKRTPETSIWLGVTIDELHRLKQPKLNWQRFVYPFCGVASTKEGIEYLSKRLQFNWLDCIQWLTNNNIVIPIKSSCFCCPYQSERSWKHLKLAHPDLWGKVVGIDQYIREGITEQKAYLHNSCTPLGSREFILNQTTLFSEHDNGSHLCHT